MKLQLKLAISTGVLILAMFGSALSVHLCLMRVKLTAYMADNVRQPFMTTAQDLQTHLTGTIVALESSLLAGPEPAADAHLHARSREVQKQVDSDLAQLREYGGRMDLGADAATVDGIIRRIQNLEDQEHQVEVQSDLGTIEGSAQARILLEQQVLPLNALVCEAIASLIESQSALQAAQLAILHQADNPVLLTLWITTILGAILGGVIAALLGRRITAAIDLLAGRANAIAQGDLTGADLNLTSDDQLGKLAIAMRRMQTNLTQIIGTVADTAGALTLSTVSMRTASDQVHRRIDQQSHQTEQAATAMQRMSASIAEVSHHTQTAAETARNAAETAREGGDIVKQVLASIQCIASAVNETSLTVSLLGDDSRRISQIVTVIDEIARKTNLLALNAAIEAARAGEQGRGFAVVAGEVRRLAESTAQATGQIAGMIQGVQDRTRSAIASMQSGTGTVEQGVATTTQAGEALQRIIGMAEQVERMITQIAIAASQQAVAANQSSSSLDAIHNLSHDNLGEITDTAVGIESLRTTAIALKQRLEGFRLPSAPIPRQKKGPAPRQALLIPLRSV